MYTFADLKKASGRKEYRLLELPENVNKKIWIPKMEFCYHRTHFHVKENFPRSKYDVVDCSNQKLGEDGKGCPICALIPKIWEQWREADKKKDVALKKKLQDQKNRLVAEEVFFNCIDIEDPELKFQAVRFTTVKAKDLSSVVEMNGNHIETVIWYYRKSKSDKGKVEYSVQNIDSPELMKQAASLWARYEELAGRDYDMGGPVDLDNSILRIQSPENIKAIIEGGDEENVETNVSSKSLKASETITIDESQSLSLGDLDGKSEDSETLEMDGLELEDVSIQTPVMKKITPDIIKANLKNVEFLKALVSFSIKSKFIADVGTINDKVKAIYKYVTDKKEIEIPEMEFAGIPF